MYVCIYIYIYISKPCGVSRRFAEMRNPHEDCADNYIASAPSEAIAKLWVNLNSRIPLVRSSQYIYIYIYTYIHTYIYIYTYAL